jgi:GST-like protein
MGGISAELSSIDEAAAECGVPVPRQSMIDFYTLTSPNALKVFLMLEECQLPYNLKFVDVWKGEQFTPEFTRINPNQKIPAIVDNDGPGGKPYTVIESGAILMYLADKAGKFLPTDKRKHFDCVQWVMLQMANIGPMFGQNVHFSRFAPAGSEYGQSRYRTQVNRLFDLYNQRLADNKYVAGDEYTIADIAAYPWLRGWEFQGVTIDQRPNVKRWVDEISQRPAAKKMIEYVPTVKSARDSATDDAKDRYFGRGKYNRA